MFKPLDLAIVKINEQGLYLRIILKQPLPQLPLFLFLFF